MGSNVRDAAAYVLWSFARSSSKEVLEPYGVQLAQSLVIVALFDREIHIRRAASAAFQENVGRMVRALYCPSHKSCLKRVEGAVSSWNRRSI